MNPPIPDKQVSEIVTPSQIQLINLRALQGFFPIIESVIMNCGVVSVYELRSEGGKEITDVGCRGPLFLVQTRHKELWLVVLNQSSFGIYHTIVSEQTQFQQQDRYLTLTHLDNQCLVQFCFISQSANEECTNVVSRLRRELSDRVRFGRLLKQAVTYCSM
ncbi:hypothetical protein EHI8A_032940 [Entamoeba histolytica HM-1:IMSS-B]|uniref:Uncharacterized protein n=6 Tax=Entamoeba histolytica TaxID=5759 RepID=C4LZ86_ENTH1|nr:hypothetical protein EHI_042970 [Entamoeba histolytica HM-1:IMSS]XP_652621.1 hypothetical protein EHI_104780 [Entamoeba histolytica HM-1:IMSS]EMD43704.1 Hypothetical protein EHI5A_040640 [Entamoeba histolytica KU27]EMH73806.1 hypothetical protein EHI8A_032940 [Entamoeba histolytica HM-1:IMSS-B]EMS15494.1 hypothetical protein KM1_077870 [Entamoeba histolytica HM-3:IMSS]ENY60738.1 hypothetical protein EHI7A_034270 [Entamoeba histolytica HM-1:IMSS-A]GAT94165.1 hypothetical protein CL6EHI_1047|eukprot:XP_650590.1 hypothetical protein EHI_042970 [Entamoeba histolytica HM-1:IMSS]